MKASISRQPISTHSLYIKKAYRVQLSNDTRNNPLFSLRFPDLAPSIHESAGTLRATLGVCFSLYFSAKREESVDREKSISTTDRVILTHCPRQIEVAKLNIVAKEKARREGRSRRINSRVCTMRQLMSHFSFSFSLSLFVRPAS